MFKMHTTILLITIVTIQSVAANTILQDQATALELIANFSDKMCSSVSTEGSGENIELSGKGKAEVGKFVKKFAGLSIDGSGKYNKTHYKGVLQKDLAKIIKNKDECKTKIWQTLYTTMLPNINGNNNSPIASLPSLKGLTDVSAKNLLNSLSSNIRVSTVYVASNGKENLVVSQTPRPETQFNPQNNTEVRLQLSKNKKNKTFSNTYYSKTDMTDGNAHAGSVSASCNSTYPFLENCTITNELGNWGKNRDNSAARITLTRNNKTCTCNCWHKGKALFGAGHWCGCTINAICSNFRK